MADPGGNRPVFTRWRLAECIVCLAVILFGLLYLQTDLLPLQVVLPVFLLAFGAVPVLRYLDEKSRGIRGLALGLSVGIAALPGLVVALALLIFCF